VHGIDNAASELEGAALATAELATGPTSVDEPAINIVLGHALSKHLSIASGVEDDEGSAVTCRERRDGF